MNVRVNERWHEVLVGGKFGFCKIDAGLIKMSDFDCELFLRLLQNETSEEYQVVSEMSRAKHWCFTLNNYTQENVDRIIDNASSFEYVIFGKEIGDSGTPRLQGFVSFPTRVRRSVCIEKIGQAHFTVARNIDNSIQYCKKDGDFVEIGVKPNGPGSRSDLENFKLAVAAGNLDMKKLRNESPPGQKESGQEVGPKIRLVRMDRGEILHYYPTSVHGPVGIYVHKSRRLDILRCHLVDEYGTTDWTDSVILVAILRGIQLSVICNVGAYFLVLLLI